MTTQTPTRRRTQLDHRQVDELTRYATGELEKAAMTFRGENGKGYFARISFGKLRAKARDILRAYPLEAQSRFAEYVAAIVRDERKSYKQAEQMRHAV